MAAIPYIGEIFSVSAAIFWATGVILFKRAGEKMPPLSLNLFKNCVALVFLPPTMLLFGEPFFPDIPTYQWVLMLLSGFFGIAVADTMFFFSLEKLGAGLTAVVDVSYTPVMLLLSFFFLGEVIALESLMGAALIMAGLLVGAATRPQKGKTRRDLLVGILVGVTGISLMAVSIIMIKGFLDDVPMVWASTVRVLAGAVGLLPIMAVSKKRRALFAALKPSPVWGKAIPAAFVGTFLAMTVWIGGMSFIDAHRAALLNQLSTIFIFVFAVIFLKEPLTIRRISAVVLAMSGAVLVATSRL